MDDRALAEFRRGDGETTADVPTVSVEDVRDSSILRLFVLHVVVWKLVLLATSLGVMLVYFEGDWDTGGRLIAAGAVLALYGAYRWPRGDPEERTPDSP